MALTKFHIINELRDADERKEIERVATYEQFLELCGGLNRQFTQLIERKNVLAQVRKMSIKESYHRSKPLSCLLETSFKLFLASKFQKFNKFDKFFSFIRALYMT